MIPAGHPEAPDRVSTGEVERLIADVLALKSHHSFTRDRIGQTGCEIRKVAAEYVETLDRVIAALHLIQELVKAAQRACDKYFARANPGSFYLMMSELDAALAKVRS